MHLGVGPAVIIRLEQMGIDSLAVLRVTPSAQTMASRGGGLRADSGSLFASEAQTSVLSRGICTPALIRLRKATL
ncbi:helix-hairpin-helix domain-containing protein [Pseudomonas fluorescens]|nr:helix-hairpin-helix domain-containing protein [Pseudomonas fluorescens]